ncbi:MAG: hypothetical protein ACKVYV_06450 [Limisphaerales bacterium]
MNARVAIAALLGLCAGLTVLSVYLLRQVNRRPADVPEAVSAVLTQRVVRVFTNPPATDRIVVRTLDWSTVESDDYAAYLENLRRIGCPEETVRDIILADVRKLYARKRAVFVQPPEDFEFWLTPAERTTAAADRRRADEEDAALRALDREERGLIRRLLGASPEALSRAETGPEPGLLREIAFLPAERRAAVAAVLASFEEREHDLLLGAEDQAAIHGQQARIKAERRAALAGLLSPDELLEHDLRASPLAEELRDAFRGAGTTRDEFVELFKLRQEAEAAMAGIPGEALDAATRREAIAAETEQAVRELLTPQRYADFERARDPDYQVLYDLALDHGVAPAVAVQVYDMRRTVAEQAGRLVEDPLLTSDQKRAGLEAIRRETERTIGEVLGAPLLDLYRESGGEWLDEVTDTARIALTAEIPPPEPPDSELATTPAP